MWNLGQVRVCSPEIRRRTSSKQDGNPAVRGRASQPFEHSGWTVESWSPVRFAARCRKEFRLSSTTFADLGVSDDVRAVLAERGITSPFPVQELVLPVARTGRDVLVSSPTGSGKTLAFGLPLIERLSPGGDAALGADPRADPRARLADRGGARPPRRRPPACAWPSATAASASRPRPEGAPRADILVATPGRLLDLARQRRVSLARHHAPSSSTRPTGCSTWASCPRCRRSCSRCPRERHTMFFSATLDGAVGTLAEQFTRDAERLRMREARSDTGETALRAARRRTSSPARPSTRTDELLDAHQAARTTWCSSSAAPAAAPAGSPSASTARACRPPRCTATSARPQREKALRRFASGTARVLVATDVAARGIDLDDIGLVVNFDPPEDHDAYTHRVGRTARAGRTGRAVTLVMPEHADQLAPHGRQPGPRRTTGTRPATPWPPRASCTARAAAARRSRPRARRAPAPPAASPRRRAANRVKRGSRIPAA